MEFLNNIFVYMAQLLRWFMSWLGLNNILTNAVMAVIYFTVIAIIVTVNIMMLLWIDRRFASFFQERLGPNRVGPFGLLQSVNDAVKLMGKESIIPKAADKTVFKLAPLLIFTITIMLYAVLPFGRGMIPAN